MSLKRLQHLGLASGIAMFLACDVRSPKVPNGERVGNTAPAPVAIAARPFASGVMLGNIARIRSNGHDQLWVVDASGDPYFHVFDTTGTLLASRGRKGSGPGEFAEVRGLFRAGEKSGAMTAYDGSGLRLTTLESDPKVAALSIVSIAGSRPMALTRVGNRLIGWTTSPDSTKRFVFIDSVGHQTGTARGDLVGGDSIPARLRLFASSNMKLCAHPAGDRFAIAYGSAGRIEIRDVNAVLVTLAKVPFPSNGDFSRNSVGELRWARTRLHYSDCSTTATHIFALYSGRSDDPNGATPPGADFGRTIHVFNWDGSFTGIIEVDQDLSSLAVDPDESTIYAVGGGNATLYRIPVSREARASFSGGVPR